MNKDLYDLKESIKIPIATDSSGIMQRENNLKNEENQE